MHIVFSDVSTGSYLSYYWLWKRSDMFDALSMYRQVKLPEELYYHRSKDFMDNQFSNIVLSPFSTYHTQRVAEKAVTHFWYLEGLMEEDCMGSIGICFMFRGYY